MSTQSTLAARGKSPAQHRWRLIALFLCASTAAQESVTDNFVIGIAQNREVVVLPSAAASTQLTTASGPILAQSFETNSTRIHTVTFEGETFRASTPMEGPTSRIVFDPAQRKFVALLPSIRVELDDFSGLDSIANSLGAVRATPFESLGFAFIDLPEALHPVEAIEILGSLPDVGEATLRLRGPQIHWW